jgi:FixJ family two-component response regulator
MNKIAPIIHIIDDDASFRSAIGELLRVCGYRVVHYKSAAQFLARKPHDEPGRILLDVRMPDLSGPQLQDHLAGLGNELPIIFVTGDGDIPTSVQTIKAGAEDFLTKPIPKERLLKAIESALSHSSEMRERGRGITVLRSLVSQLTPREHDLFILLARGWPHKKIAHSFGTSERTIKFHRHNVMEKLEVHSLAELAVVADRLGLLSNPVPAETEA